MRQLPWIFFFTLFSFIASGTHEVSGFIRFQCLGEYTYSVTVTTYTNTYQTLADRDSLEFYWGDGDSTSVPRINGPLNYSIYHWGVPICNWDYSVSPPQAELGARKINIYTGVHTYPGPGVYRTTFDDPDRMANIYNMNGSVNVIFHLFNTLIITDSSENVQTPVITNLPVCQFACGTRCFEFNLNAYSPNGDSLVYSLGPCLTVGGSACNGYFIPPTSSIDPNTGTLTFCDKDGPGIFNFSIRILSLRRDYLLFNNQYIKNIFPVDTQEVELEVIDTSMCPPDTIAITGVRDTCVVAGSTVNLTYTATYNSDIYMYAGGVPFSLTPPATFSSNSPNRTDKGIFKWTTNCSEVRQQPYNVVVTASHPYDFYDSLYTYFTSSIYVLAPGPANLKAKDSGSYVYLHWNPSSCPQANGYQIFRYSGAQCNCFTPVCEAGVPASSGFSLIASLSAIDDTTYLDSNGGSGLAPDVYYSYVIVATFPFPDASLSKASKCACIKINRTLPVITNVSVITTNSSGANYIRWTRPLGSDSINDSIALDTLIYKGPYTYNLLRATGINGNTFIAIQSQTVPFFRTVSLDTTYRDSALNLNTIANGYNYRLDFYSNSKLVGPSATASSIYLNASPGNHIVNLNWGENVPWNDTVFYVYRKNPDTTGYKKIATSKLNTYTDNNLINDRTYCYYVESAGLFNDLSILHPLYDSSQWVCAVPVDTIPPCTPTFTVTAKCDLYEDSLKWNNPSLQCPYTSGVAGYLVYYTPIEGGDLQLIATINNPNETLFVNDSLTSIAGCYAVVAIDSAGRQSKYNTICVDNCPQYELPNVFTPNGDGINDLFTPILPIRYIKGIDIDIYNRWGQIMYTTNNPLINWTGIDQQTGQPCPDGVYFYICKVYEIRITGIKTVIFKGYVQILRGESQGAK